MSSVADLEAKIADAGAKVELAKIQHTNISSSCVP